MENLRFDDGTTLTNKEQGFLFMVLGLMMIAVALSCLSVAYNLKESLMGLV